MIQTATPIYFIVCALMAASQCSQEGGASLHERCASQKSAKLIGINDASFILEIDGITVATGPCHLLKDAEMQAAFAPHSDVRTPTITFVWRSTKPSEPFFVQIDHAEILKTYLLPLTATEPSNAPTERK